MQQEIIRKKQEIIEIFLKNGLLISSELLNEIKDHEQASKIFDFLKSKKIDEAVIDRELNNLLKDPIAQLQAEQKIDREPPQDHQKKVKIIYSYKEEPKKREPQDFVDYFNNRYKALEKILKQHQELKGTVSINRLSNKKEKESTAIIGIVNEKQFTKNGNLMLLLEDPTGQKKVIVNKNKPSLFNEAKDIVQDEVIGITGVTVENIIFANNIIWPDVPSSNELKKMEGEKYALFLSDLHVGSSKFLAEDFEKFLKWINCEIGNEQQKHIARNVEYIFIAGDLVDGVGVYPEQNKELEIDDIHSQYEECARLLSQIPQRIKIIVCPGNHDSTRMSEPQPAFTDKTAKALLSLPNIVSVSNPSILKIGVKEGFDGFTVLLYHGYSFDYYVANVDSIRQQGGYDRADLLMKFLLQRRHMAPAYSSTLYLPEIKDYLVIDNPPDFFVTGHIHKTSVSNYKNTTLISGSCWQSKTLFQEKVGHHPEPAKVPVANLRTREIKILKFGD